MERERRQEHRTHHAGDGSPGNSGSLDAIRNQLQGAYEAAEQALSSIGPVDAEDYLQRNQQRGGQ